MVKVENQGSIEKHIGDLLTAKGLTSEVTPQPDPEASSVGVSWLGLVEGIRTVLGMCAASSFICKRAFD